MVSCYVGPDLSKDASKHEELFFKRGPAAYVVSFCAFAVVGTGVWALVPGTGPVAAAAPVPRFTDDAGRGGAAPPPPYTGDLSFPVRDTDFDEEFRRVYSAAGLAAYTAGTAGFGSSQTLQDQGRFAGMDFSLVFLCLVVFGCCVVPAVSRAVSAVPPGGAAKPMATPWSGGQAAAAAPSATNPFGADGGARRPLIDVKPGELRGTGGGVGHLFGGAGGFGAGAGWTQGNWSQVPPASSSSSAPWGGSGLAAPAAPLAPAPAAPKMSWRLPGFGAGAPLGGSTLGAAIGALTGQNSHGPGVLPSEVEVTETYAAFGVELQAWTPAVAAFIDREVIEALLRGLDESDQLWNSALARSGWRLTTEAPRLQGYGLGASTQEVSVFDKHLPPPFCNDPRAVDLWGQRQKLESYLVHPCFEPAQRQFVLERLREWRHRGLASAMRYELRPSDFMPTDAHILENLVVKMLNLNLDFASCFLASGHSSPQTKHLGQTPAAYMRVVTDQSAVPRPAPHYEVVTMQKTWKLRPGNANILEALALMLHALRRDSRSYQSFPQAIRTAFENASSNVPVVGTPWRGGF